MARFQQWTHARDRTGRDHNRTNRNYESMRTMSALLAASLSTLAFTHLASADATDNLDVSATVASSCTIAGGTLSFGTYNTVSGAQVDGSALITVACTTGTDTTVTLGEGTHAGGASSAAAPDRRMNDGGTNFLSYSLFSNTQRTTIWGNTVGSGLDYQAVTSAPSQLSVFGRIAATQDVPAGSYTDTVVATIAF
jgi:spore coat protein U-like protein